MRFSVDQYHVRAKSKESDLKNPFYRAGQVYTIRPENIARWLKRGGQIIVGEDRQPKVEAPPAMTDEKEQAPPEGSEEQVVDGPEKSEDNSKPAPHKSKKSKRH